MTNPNIETIKRQIEINNWTIRALFSYVDSDGSWQMPEYVVTSFNKQIQHLEYENKEHLIRIDKINAVELMHLPYKLGDKVMFNGVLGRDGYIEWYERSVQRANHIRNRMDSVLSGVSEIKSIDSDDVFLSEVQGDLVTHRIPHDKMHFFKVVNDV